MGEHIPYTLYGYTNKKKKLKKLTKDVIERMKKIFNYNIEK